MNTVEEKQFTTYLFLKIGIMIAISIAIMQSYILYLEASQGIGYRFLFFLAIGIIVTISSIFTHKSYLRLKLTSTWEELKKDEEISTPNKGLTVRLFSLVLIYGHCIVGIATIYAKFKS